MTDDLATDLGIDVHVVTLEASASTIEEQSEQVFRERKIAANAPTGGLLILLSPASQAARIEVGYSLEGGADRPAHGPHRPRPAGAPYVALRLGRHGGHGRPAIPARRSVLSRPRARQYSSSPREYRAHAPEYRRATERYLSGGAGAQDCPHERRRRMRTSSAPVPASDRALLRAGDGT